MTSERQFPLQTSRAPVKSGPLSIPWGIAEKAFSEYARLYGTSQSLERLAQRGGFSWGEMDMFYPPWRDECDRLKILEAAIRDIETYLENAGPSECAWDHIAGLLRQHGFAQGPVFDAHFEGTSLERKAPQCPGS